MPRRPKAVAEEAAAKPRLLRVAAVVEADAEAQAADAEKLLPARHRIKSSSI